MTADENEIHRGFKSSVKGVLKKKNDWSIEVQVGDDSLIDEYYRMHQITMKKLGTPPHSKKFFANISELMGENSSFIYAFAEDTDCGNHRHHGRIQVLLEVSCRSK